MASVPTAYLKFAIVLIALLSIAVAISAQACIPNGGACQFDGGPPFCCSGFCLQQIGQSSGSCQNRS